MALEVLAMIATNADPIQIAYPNLSDLRLHLALGVCRVRITPGRGDTWVTGTFQDQSGPMLYNVTKDGGTIRLSTGWGPEAVMVMPGRGPVVDLVLGGSRPFALTVELDGGELEFELGGLPLTRLVLKQGAGRADVIFSDRNPFPMTLFQYSTGAGVAEFRELANANCAEFVLEGGAISYRCDFGGTLQRNATVRIATGASSLDIDVPATTPADVVAHALVGVAGGGADWTLWNGVLLHGSLPEDALPLLQFSATAAVGPVHVHTS
jgi:hypothetical protein